MARTRGGVATARAVAGLALSLAVAVLIDVLDDDHRGWAVAAVVAVGLLVAVEVVIIFRRSGAWRAAVAVVVSLGLGVAMAAIAGAIVDHEKPVVATDATARTIDPIGDCEGCPASRDLRGLAVRADGDAGLVQLELGATPAIGDELWFWFDDAPAAPMRLTRAAGGWTASTAADSPVDPSSIAVSVPGPTLAVRVPGGSALGGVAVVSSGGDRIPDVGVVFDGPRAAPIGDLARSLEQDLAAVESDFGRLDTLQQELARTLLTRELVAGTATYDVELASNRGTLLSARVVARFPDFAQHLSIRRDGASLLAQSLYATKDDLVVCTWFTDGSSSCSPASEQVRLPVQQLAAMVADPEGVIVRVAPARSIAGEPVRCLDVVSTVAGGPSRGETCSRRDGALALNDNDDTGHRLVLVDQTADVDAVALHPPRAR